MAIAEYLYRKLKIANQPNLEQGLGRNMGAGLKTILKRLHIHNAESPLELSVVEPALRHAPKRRHLTAFLHAALAPAGTLAKTLIASAGSFTPAGPATTTYALTTLFGPG